MDTTALFKLSYGLYVTGVKTEKGFGGHIIDSVGQVAAGDKPLVMVSCMKRNYTNESLHTNGELTLSILPADVNPFVIGNFGFQSARDVDKWANVPHTMKDGLPVLDGCVAYLRLKVETTTELSDHTMYICSLTDAWIGTGAKPLIYADYQASLKGAVGEAFKTFKETGKSPMLS
jgi:flavin reductase (DIM6/NTAB) family NADH-FMN oxidoreductase RutF